MSRLFLKAENQNGKTVISESFFTSPIKIAKPFYFKNYTEIMMMVASAGMLDGDFYDIEINAMEKTSLKFTGQSYTKIFKATEKGAVQKVKINVGKDADFIYFPMPVIPYEESIFSNFTEIRLDKDCRFVMCDIFSSGRKAMNEQFMFRQYRSRTAVYIDGKLKFLDNQRLIPNEIDLNSLGFFEGYSHSGIIYIYGLDIPEDLELSAVTKSKEGTLIRVFSNSADEISNKFKEIIQKLKY